MTPDLDTRARAAASSLHDALADRPLPTDVVPLRSGQMRTVLTAAAVLVAVAALATALLWPGNEDDGSSGLATTSGEVPRLVPTYVPDGFELAGAAEISSSDTGRYSMWVYGDPTTPDNPFATRDLVIGVTSATPDPDHDSPLPSPGKVTLADLGGPEERLDGESPSVTLDLGNGQLATVSSRTLSDEEVVAVANQLRGGDPTPALPTELPEGLELLATEDKVGVGGLAPGPAGDGFGVAYQSEDRDRGLYLTVTSTDIDPLIALIGLSGEITTTEVRGTTAWLDQNDGYTTLLWEEDGATVSVSVNELSTDELVRVAESLEPVDDETWGSLVAASDDGVTVDRSASVSVVDALSDGGTWSVYVDADDSSLCLEVPSPDGVSEGSCSGSDGSSPELQAGVSETSSGELLVYGTTTLANVDNIGLSVPMSTAAIPEANGGGTLFAGIVTPAELPAELVVTDAATGEELDRIALDRGSLSQAASTATTIAR